MKREKLWAFMISMILTLILAGMGALLFFYENRDTRPALEIEEMDPVMYKRLKADFEKTTKGTEGERPYVEEPDEALEIDYDFLEKRHKILEKNICVSPRPYEENPLLKELFWEKFQETDRFYEEMYQKVHEFEDMEYEKGSAINADFFAFDFNADGQEDYLVCQYGMDMGSHGNPIEIYVQEDGALRKVFDVVDCVHGAKEHAPIAVLAERTDGFYAIVLPYAKSNIWIYNGETGMYE